MATIYRVGTPKTALKRLEQNTHTQKKRWLLRNLGLKGFLCFSATIFLLEIRMKVCTLPNEKLSTPKKPFKKGGELL